MDGSEIKCASIDELSSTSASGSLKPKVIKRRSLVERELETNMTARVTSPINNGEKASNTSRYGRARKLKHDLQCHDTDKAVTQLLISPDFQKILSHSPSISVSSNSPKSVSKTNSSTPKLETQTEITCNDKSLVNSFTTDTKTSSTERKVYIRKDLIQRKDTDDCSTVSNLLSPGKSPFKRSSYSHLNNILERSSVEYGLNKMESLPDISQAGLSNRSSVIKVVNFDGSKKKRSNKTISKTNLKLKDDTAKSLREVKTIKGVTVMNEKKINDTKVETSKNELFQTQKPTPHPVVKTLDFDDGKKKKRDKTIPKTDITKDRDITNPSPKVKIIDNNEIQMAETVGSKKRNDDIKIMLSKNELFQMEALSPYQVGDLAWSRIGTYPFWPCIVTREPFSEMFVKKKMFGRIEHHIIHVTFFGDNGRRGWIVDKMLRPFVGLQEFESTKDQFTAEDKKKDPRLYAAFFISDKKKEKWNISVEEAETLMREPKRLRIDALNNMLLQCTPVKTSKRAKGSKIIDRTDSDVSLSESLYDTLFSEDDSKADDLDRSRNRSRNKSLDVSEVVTACLDNMAAKTGISKIQKQSHMDIWLQKAKSKTPEKPQTITQIVKVKENKFSLSLKKNRKTPAKEQKISKYTLRKMSKSPITMNSYQTEHDYTKYDIENENPVQNRNCNSFITENNVSNHQDININDSINGIGIISKVETLSDKLLQQSTSSGDRNFTDIETSVVVEVIVTDSCEPEVESVPDKTDTNTGEALESQTESTISESMDINEPMESSNVSQVPTDVEESHTSDTIMKSSVDSLIGITESSDLHSNKETVDSSDVNLLLNEINFLIDEVSEPMSLTGDIITSKNDMKVEYGIDTGLKRYENVETKGDAGVAENEDKYIQSEKSQSLKNIQEPTTGPDERATTKSYEFVVNIEREEVTNDFSVKKSHSEIVEECNVETNKKKTSNKIKMTTDKNEDALVPSEDAEINCVDNNSCNNDYSSVSSEKIESDQKSGDLENNKESNVSKFENITQFKISGIENDIENGVTEIEIKKGKVSKFESKIGNIDSFAGNEKKTIVPKPVNSLECASCEEEISSDKNCLSKPTKKKSSGNPGFQEIKEAISCGPESRLVSNDTKTIEQDALDSLMFNKVVNSCKRIITSQESKKNSTGLVNKLHQNTELKLFIKIGNQLDEENILLLDRSEETDEEDDDDEIPSPPYESLFDDTEEENNVKETAKKTGDPKTCDKIPIDVEKESDINIKTKENNDSKTCKIPLVDTEKENGVKLMKKETKNTKIYNKVPMVLIHKIPAQNMTNGYIKHSPKLKNRKDSSNKVTKNVEESIKTNDKTDNVDNSRSNQVADKTDDEVSEKSNCTKPRSYRKDSSAKTVKMVDNSIKINDKHNDVYNSKSNKIIKTPVSAVNKNRKTHSTQLRNHRKDSPDKVIEKMDVSIKSDKLNDTDNLRSNQVIDISDTTVTKKRNSSKFRSHRKESPAKVVETVDESIKVMDKNNDDNSNSNQITDKAVAVVNKKSDTRSPKLRNHRKNSPGKITEILDDSIQINDKTNNIDNSISNQVTDNMAAIVTENSISLNFRSHSKESSAKVIEIVDDSTKINTKPNEMVDISINTNDKPNNIDNSKYNQITDKPVGVVNDGSEIKIKKRKRNTRSKDIESLKVSNDISMKMDDDCVIIENNKQPSLPSSNDDVIEVDSISIKTEIDSVRSFDIESLAEIKSESPISELTNDSEYVPDMEIKVESIKEETRPKRKTRGKQENIPVVQTNEVYKALDDPEFVKYLELRQDQLLDENPHISQDDVVKYLHKTWIYQQSLKSDAMKSDDIEQSNLVKGLNQEPSSKPKKVRSKKIKKEKDSTLDEFVIPKDKPKRYNAKACYREDDTDFDDEIESFEIIKSEDKITTSSSLKTLAEIKAELKSETQEMPVENEMTEQEIEDEIERYFANLTQPKPNVFKGLPRERVCEICDKTGNLLKCKGLCGGMFHEECVKKAMEPVIINPKTRGKKKRRGRKPKNYDETLDESISDEKSEENNVSIENIKLEPIVIDGDNFEAKFSEKMQELLKNDAPIEIDSSSDEELTWNDIESGKCTIVDIKPKTKTLNTNENFKCHDCQKYDTPLCFICKSDKSPKNVTELRQKCSGTHCHKFYHFDCLDQWPQTQFNDSESSKKAEHFDAFTCPRHVCHTCVCDDPRGCKTRFSGDKLAKCVKCPATYHSFTKCLPAGSTILSGSFIICPRHGDNKTGKIPCHVNTGWCFICALGGTLICCEYCPTSFHAECLNIKPPEGNYMCEDCETGRLPVYGEMVWVKLGHYRWWPAIILHPCEVPHNIWSVKHSPGEFVVRFFGQYDHYWVNRGRVFPFQEGDTGKISSQKSKIDEAFTLAIEHAHRAFDILKKAAPNEEEDTDIQSSLLPPHYVKLRVNKPCGSLANWKIDEEANSLSQCDCDPNTETPCAENTPCLNRMLLTECGPSCRAGDRCHNRAFEKRQYPRLQPRRAPHRGWGLRALDPIRAGQFVIEYVGELIDMAEFQRRMRRKHDVRDENYYFLTLDKDRMIDAGPKGNLARFMNHSCEPNCETQKWTVLGDVRVGLFAINDIPANSEVTFNYNLECAGIDKKRCMCGATRCSGYIGAKPKQLVEVQPRTKPKRVYKKRKAEESPVTVKTKPKPRTTMRSKPKELTEIEKDLLIIKNATNGISSDSECSGILSTDEKAKTSRLSSTDTENFKTNKEKTNGLSDKELGKSKNKASKRKRVNFSTEEVILFDSEVASPSAKKVKVDSSSGLVNGDS